MTSGQRQRVERRLAAILAADVAGYSRLMGADEEGTLAALKAIRRELGDPKIGEHRGRIVKTTGDGLLVEFPSIVDAVRCAVEVQRAMTERNAAVPADRRIEFRIGINLGDIIIIDEGDIYGDGVNVAARLEALAEPGGICVSRVVRDQVRDRLDLAFEDMGERQVKNIARPVHVYRIGPRPPEPLPKGRPHAGGTPAVQLALPDKPSLAVLPFQNLSGDPEQEYFVDGIVEEITTAIARLPWLFVIARNSSFTYKGRAADVKQVARELGVRYVLEGSVRKAGNRVRVTGQLIDTASGAHIWADRFDGALDDIFELQDQVAGSVIGAIEPKLRRSEIERAARKPTQSLDAYDLYLRALAEFHKLTPEGYRTCISLLRRALEIDSGYAPAAALIGWCRIRQRTLGATTPEEIAEAVRLARQTIASGKDDPEALWMAGIAVTLLSGAHALGLNAIQRALVLNPNSASAWGAAGWVQPLLNPDAAVDAFARAMRLSPLDPARYLTKSGLALAHATAGRHDEAMHWIDQSLRDQPYFVPAINTKIALCDLLGRDQERQDWVARLLELVPNATIAGLDAGMSNIMAPEIRAALSAGLRKAGLPEG